MEKIRALTFNEKFIEKKKIIDVARKYSNKRCVYLLDFGDNHYKFGISSNIVTRMKTHFRNHQFNKIVGIWNCGGMLRYVENFIKGYARNNDILKTFRKETEVVKTDDVKSLIKIIENKIEEVVDDTIKYENISDNTDINNDTIKYEKITDIDTTTKEIDVSNDMADQKVYNFTAKYKKKDGTISQYPVRRIYTAKPREAAKGPIIESIRNINDKDTLIDLKHIIDYLIESKDNSSKLREFINREKAENNGEN